MLQIALLLSVPNLSEEKHITSGDWAPLVFYWYLYFY